MLKDYFNLYNSRDPKMVRDLGVRYFSAYLNLKAYVLKSPSKSDNSLCLSFGLEDIIQISRSRFTNV